MTQPNHNITQRQAAIITGSMLLLMVAAVIVALPMTIGLIVPGDASKTLSQIKAAGISFRIGIVGWFVVLACDVIVSWSFYQYFKPINQGISLLTAWFRLFYTAIFAAALSGLIIVLVLLDGGEHLSAFTTKQLHAMVLLTLNGLQKIWLFGLGFFGIHLLGLGYLALRSGVVPKALGVLLVLASCGYMADTMAYIVLADYKAYKGTIQAIVSGPNTLGELGFGLWLLWRGGKQSPQEGTGKAQKTHTET